MLIKFRKQEEPSTATFQCRISRSRRMTCSTQGVAPAWALPAGQVNPPGYRRCSIYIYIYIYIHYIRTYIHTAGRYQAFTCMYIDIYRYINTRFKSIEVRVCIYTECCILHTHLRGLPSLPSLSRCPLLAPPDNMLWLSKRPDADVGLLECLLPV